MACSPPFCKRRNQGPERQDSHRSTLLTTGWTSVAAAALLLWRAASQTDSQDLHASGSHQENHSNAGVMCSSELTLYMQTVLH